MICVNRLQQLLLCHSIWYRAYYALFKTWKSEFRLGLGSLDLGFDCLDSGLATCLFHLLENNSSTHPDVYSLSFAHILPLADILYSRGLALFMEHMFPWAPAAGRCKVLPVLLTVYVSSKRCWYWGEEIVWWKRLRCFLFMSCCHRPALV